MKILSILALVVALFGAVPVMSAELGRCFYSMDTNGDDLVDQAEILLAFPDEGTQILAEADTDSDGGVGHEEWEEYKLSKGIVEDHE